MNPGSYVHIGLRRGLDHLNKLNSEVVKIKEFVLDFNVDGLPLSKSSNNCFWVILCRIVYIKRSFVFAVRVYSVYKKLDSFNEFLNPFVNELLFLLNSYTYNDQFINLKYTSIRL